MLNSTSHMLCGYNGCACVPAACLTSSATPWTIVRSGLLHGISLASIEWLLSRYLPGPGINSCVSCTVDITEPHRTPNTSDLGLGDSAPIASPLNWAVLMHCPPTLNHSFNMFLGLAVQEAKVRPVCPFHNSFKVEGIGDKMNHIRWKINILYLTHLFFAGSRKVWDKRRPSLYPLISQIIRTKEIKDEIKMKGLNRDPGYMTSCYQMLTDLRE